MGVFAFSSDGKVIVVETLKIDFKWRF